MPPIVLVQGGGFDSRCWPSDTPTRAAFNQLVSRARVLLGAASDGLPYIPHVQGGPYRPSRHLVSDPTLLERALATDGKFDEVQIKGRSERVVNGDACQL